RNEERHRRQERKPCQESGRDQPQISCSDHVRLYGYMNTPPFWSTSIEYFQACLVSSPIRATTMGFSQRLGLHRQIFHARFGSDPLIALLRLSRLLWQTAFLCEHFGLFVSTHCSQQRHILSP